MSLYVMADTHLSLTSGKPMDIFSDRWKDHTEKIKTRWEALISENDTVVIPGDISWSMSLEGAIPDLLFLSKLPGRKIISKGNHEYWWSTAAKIEKAFKEAGIDNISLLYNNSLYAEGFSICGTRGWYSEDAAPGGTDYPKIVARECGRLERSLMAAESADKEAGRESEKLVFLHFPPVLERFVCPDIIDVMKRHSVKRCFFGHIHGKYDIPHEFEYDGIKMRLISSDFLDFYPLIIPHE